MELKTKKNALFDIFGLKENETFPDAIRRVIYSGDSSYYDKYLESCPDLSKDELRSIWQFWYADREEKKQDYTSDSLARLCSKLALLENGTTVYDCCAGTGALTIAAWNIKKDIFAVCDELDADVIPILLFNLIVRNIPSYICCKDLITGEIFACWEIHKGNKYGNLNRKMICEPYAGKIDCAVSNPPFNLNIGGTLKNYYFVEKCIELSERCAVILPRGVLINDREKPYRKNLVDNQQIVSVIQCPDKIFESTGIPVCILVLNKKPNKGLFVIDATQCEEITRLQRGEGDKSHTERLYQKKMNVYSDEQINAICACTFTETDLSKFVPYSLIEEKEYNWSYGIYKEPVIDEQNTKHRDFNDIVADINKITRLKNTIKITINRVWADELKINIGESAEQDKGLVTEINGYLKLLGISERLIEPNYYAISNSKVLEIKQNDKEILSPVFEQFIPLWQQHIKTMNVLEDQLFAEFRDALLPALMTGRLSLEK